MAGLIDTEKSWHVVFSMNGMGSHLNYIAWPSGQVDLALPGRPGNILPDDTTIRILNPAWRGFNLCIGGGRS